MGPTKAWTPADYYYVEIDRNSLGRFIAMFVVLKNYYNTKRPMHILCTY